MWGNDNYQSGAKFVQRGERFNSRFVSWLLGEQNFISKWYNYLKVGYNKI